MLSLLHIENIAIIESADIRFDGGFNVLTGETGAGKSIVIDAIGAVLGERTSRELIRTGARSALVTAVFTGLPKLRWLEDNGFPPQGEELLLQREIQGDGRNVCRVDGRPLTVAQLRELGRQLLNIHGQHDGQQLLDPESHLDYLDCFGRTGDLLKDYQSSYQAMSEKRRQIASLEMDEAERSRRVDTLTYQIQELERAGLKPGEDEELDARKTLMRSAGKLMDALQAAEYALGGDEDNQGACALIADAEGELRGVARLSPQIGALADQVSTLRAAAEDALESLRDQGRELDFSPEELDRLESRLDILYRMKKKYGSTVADMLDYLERSRQELDQIQDADDTIARLQKELSQVRAQAREKGERLSHARKEAALSLQQRVQEELRQLDMLARIMLALKNVLAEDDGVGSLVFDEVDTGVSGRAAQKVAEKMAQVARRKQVLCVTHLPQIAAMADTHFSVQKGERDGRTYTHVERLDRAGRGEELARLIGGSSVTELLRQSAEQLLAEGEKYRNVLREAL